jgi:3D (Asp-Asp-Asp) domain-containing protein
MLAEGATIVLLSTAYSIGCGARPHSLTKAQTRPQAGMTVAADPRVLPLGSRIVIRGLPGVWHVHDTGRLVRGRHIDLFVGSCEEARTWGRRRVQAWVVHIPKKEK